MIPVKPPIVNRKTKPNDHKIGVSNCSQIPCRVASHLKILMPVGTAMIIVAAVK